MAKTFIFILGRNYDLSRAEILAVCKKKDWSFHEVSFTREVLLLESEDIDSSYLQRILGGTVKIGIVEKVSNVENLEQDLDIGFIEKNILSHYSGKIQFGISVYDGGDRNTTEELASKIIEFSKGIKALLEENGKSVRFAFSRERTLSSVTVSKNKLIEKGAELLLIPTRDHVQIGKTLFVQEFEAFSKRDYGRPARDMKSGVMPPKLARMMINLAAVSLDSNILDPFCGSGTILQEAILLGYKNILGRDISEKAVSDTIKNLEWLEKEVGNFDSDTDVKVGSAEKLNDISAGSISAVIAEPYLGPTLHNIIFPEKLQNISRELSQLYLNSFRAFHRVLEKDGVVVMILPVFTQRRGAYFLPIIPEIEKIGFKQEKIGDPHRGSIVYGNKHDFVQREIFVFHKKP